MKYILEGFEHQKVVEEVILSVLLDQDVVRIYQSEQKQNYLHIQVFEDSVLVTLYFKDKMFTGKKTLFDNKIKTEKPVQHILKLCIYETLMNIAETIPNWGALTGVRPAKLIRKFLIEGMTYAEIIDLLTSYYHVTNSRANLAITCAKYALEEEKTISKDEISIYAGIPFCPSRCSYCSFVSHSIDKAQHLIIPYVDALLDEISYTKNILNDKIKISSIYLGGGTPTTLRALELDRIMKSLNVFNKNSNVEFTVEAGRPDTIDYDKLCVIYENKATRISINPQTMNDDILQNIGRKHSAYDVLQKYRLARDIGFKNINMDLIAGLSGDTVKSFTKSLETLIDLNPENITVHSLAVKKGASIKNKSANYEQYHITQKMLDASWELLTMAGYVPYYTYRQKFMSGGFENIGWAKPNHICKYNILMMEDIQSICAFGAGAATKYVDFKTKKIERFTNAKYPYEYINFKEKNLSNKENFIDLIETQRR